MKNLVIGFSVIGLLAFNSCGKSDAVETSEAKEEAEASELAANFMIDSGVSVVNWRGFKVFEDKSKEESGHNGIINVTAGKVSVEGGKLTAGEFDIDVNTLSVEDIGPEEGSEDLKGHLLDGDFLDAANFPSAKFVITEVKDAEGDFNSEISGNLTLRGVEKNISFPANVEVTEEGVKINSDNFYINRKDFGSEYGLEFNKGAAIKNDVGIQIAVSAITEAAMEEMKKTEEPAAETDSATVETGEIQTSEA